MRKNIIAILFFCLLSTICLADDSDLIKAVMPKEVMDPIYLKLANLITIPMIEKIESSGISVSPLDNIKLQAFWADNLKTVIAEDKIKNIVQASYTHNFTSQEITEIIAFYSTKTGKKLLKTNFVIQQSIEDETTAMIGKDEKFYDKIQKILSKMLVEFPQYKGLKW
jgi:hypothetical protein